MHCGGQRTAACCLRDAGTEPQEILVIAGFQWHIDDGLGGHGSADHRAGGVQHGGGRGYLDGLRHLAGNQLRIDSRILPKPQRDVLPLESLESVRGGANGVCAGIQVGRDIFAGLISGQCARDAGLRVGYGHHGPGDDAAGLIADGAENAACINLREQRRTG